MPNNTDIADSSTVAPVDESAQTPDELAMTDAFYESGRVKPGDGDEAWKDRAAGRQPKPKSDSDIMEQARNDDEEKPELVDGDEETPEETPEESEGKKTGLFDRDRQRLDIERANTRKREEAYQETITELADIVKTLKAGPPKEDTSEADAAKEIDAILDSLKTVDNDGNGATAEQVATAIRKIRAIDAKIAAKGPGPSSEIKEIREKLDSLGAQMAEDRAERDAAESSAMLIGLLDGFDRQYSTKGKGGKVLSGQYRNDVIKVVQKQLADQGLGRDNLPHSDHVRLLLDAAYREAFAADPKNKGLKPPRKKVNVPVDTGKGGSQIPVAPVHGDNDQVFAAMARSGEFN